MGCKTWFPSLWIQFPSPPQLLTTAAAQGRALSRALQTVFPLSGLLTNAKLTPGSWICWLRSMTLSENLTLSVDLPQSPEF